MDIKPIIHSMEALVKNDKRCHNRLDILEKTTAVLAKAAFSDLAL